MTRNPSRRQKIGRNTVDRHDNLSPEARHKNMQAIRASHTAMEDRISHELWRRGLRYRRNVPGLMGKPDIASKKRRVAVFLDSCFWHACPYHGNRPKTNAEYWDHKLERNKVRDAEVTHYYQSRGWHVIRVWEHEVKENFDGVVEEIADLLSNGSGEDNK
jgi:DNA mismatch endonuclease (patch repair protein)